MGPGLRRDDETRRSQIPRYAACTCLLFANSLLALDARTGKRLWHFQMVHHDLWDYDLPAAPKLLTVKHNGKNVDAIAQPTKFGFLYVFDRVTAHLRTLSQTVPPRLRQSHWAKRRVTK